MNRKERRAEAKTVKAGALPLALAAAFGEAVRLHQAGRLAEADAYYRHVLAAHPRHADSRHLMGVLAHQIGQPDVAEQMIREAIALEPRMGAFHANLGNVLRAQGRMADALASYQTALALEPASATAHNNLALGLKAVGRLDEAGAAARQALAVQPDFPEAHAALGAILADTGRLDAAEPALRHAIALRPGYAEAYDDLGTVLKEQGLAQDAVSAFREAVRLKPDFANAHNNLAMALLAEGAFAEGWREYEWRWRTPRLAPAARAYPQPQWRGEAGEGRALLLWAEQGFGDTIQFCRYAALAHDRGFRVVLEVQPPLARLLKDVQGVDQLVAQGEPLPPFDLHCPLLSLPLALDTRLETIPGSASCLVADASEAVRWAGRLGDGLKVGIAWSGNPNTTAHARRSLPPDQLARLIGAPGARFVSLQKDAEPPRGLPILDLMDEAGDFAVTAALIANLDLVISVDTAVAHLAGAMGKPVWLLDRFDPDWRWLLGRRVSPWYPTMTIYRQPSPGDWGAVVEAVTRDLGDLAVG
jgi:tetratricopeptide (TPR) repeat protein